MARSLFSNTTAREDKAIRTLVRMTFLLFLLIFSPTSKSVITARACGSGYCSVARCDSSVLLRNQFRSKTLPAYPNYIFIRCVMIFLALPVSVTILYFLQEHRYVISRCIEDVTLTRWKRVVRILTLESTAFARPRETQHDESRDPNHSRTKSDPCES